MTSTQKTSLKNSQVAKNLMSSANLCYVHTFKFFKSIKQPIYYKNIVWNSTLMMHLRFKSTTRIDTNQRSLLGWYQNAKLLDFETTLASYLFFAQLAEAQQFSNFFWGCWIAVSDFFFFYLMIVVIRVVTFFLINEKN